MFCYSNTYYTLQAGGEEAAFACFTERTDHQFLIVSRQKGHHG